MSDKATIEAMLKSGDPAKEAQALDMLSGSANSEINAGPDGLPEGTQAIPVQPVQPVPVQPVEQAVPVPVQPVQEQPQENQFNQYVQPPVEPVAPANPNLYTTTYNGKNVSMDNTDGFLGRGSQEGIYNAFLNADARLGDIRVEHREVLSQAHEELDRLQAENKALKEQSQPIQQQPLYNQLAQQQYNQAPPPPQQPSQPPVYNGTSQQPPVQQNPVQNGYTPIAHPNDDYDFTTEYTTQINSGFDHVNSNQANMQTQLDEMKKKNDDYLSGLKTQEEQRTIQNDNDAWASKINQFMDKQERFKILGGDIYKYDAEQATPFINAVAEENGLYPPAQRDKESIIRYEQEKNRLAKAFLNNDPIVREKARNIQVPNGIMEFSEITDLIKQQGERQLFDSTGKSVKEDIEDIWLRNQMKNGGIQNLVNVTGEQQRAEGARAAMSVANGLHNNATNLSNSHNSQAPAAPLQMDAPTAMRILKSDPKLRNTPEAQAAYEAAQSFAEQYI